MAMFLDSDDDEMVVEINTTPLIDVMLVLLIMLIITIPMQTHAVKLDMPGTTAAATTPPPVIEVEVVQDGTILWNREAVTDVEGRMRAVAQLPDQPEVHLRPHRLARYEPVAAVLAAAQRNGVRKLGIVGTGEYGE